MQEAYTLTAWLMNPMGILRWACRMSDNPLTAKELAVKLLHCADEGGDGRIVDL